jgi:hypothetical protein
MSRIVRTKRAYLNIRVFRRGYNNRCRFVRSKVDRRVAHRLIVRVVTMHLKSLLINH